MEEEKQQIILLMPFEYTWTYRAAVGAFCFSFSVDAGVFSLFFFFLLWFIFWMIQFRIDCSAWRCFSVQRRRRLRCEVNQRKNVMSVGGNDDDRTLAAAKQHTTLMCSPHITLLARLCYCISSVAVCRCWIECVLEITPSAVRMRRREQEAKCVVHYANGRIRWARCKRRKTKCMAWNHKQQPMTA